METAALVLFGTWTAVNAAASTPDHGQRRLESPAVKPGPLPGRVRVDDQLRITVKGEPDLSGLYRVSSTGTVDYPFVGRLTVLGLKPTAVAKLIAEKLTKGYMKDSQVSVELESDQKPPTSPRR